MKRRPNSAEYEQTLARSKRNTWEGKTEDSGG